MPVHKSTWFSEHLLLNLFPSSTNKKFNCTCCSFFLSVGWLVSSVVDLGLVRIKEQINLKKKIFLDLWILDLSTGTVGLLFEIEMTDSL